MSVDLGRGSVGGGLPVPRRSARASACGSGASQVIQDAVDHLGLGDERDEAHCLAASRTRERVDLEDPAQQLRPAGGHFDQFLFITVIQWVENPV